MRLCLVAMGKIYAIGNNRAKENHGASQPRLESWPNSLSRRARKKQCDA